VFVSVLSLASRPTPESRPHFCRPESNVKSVGCELAVIPVLRFFVEIFAEYDMSFDALFREDRSVWLAAARRLGVFVAFVMVSGRSGQ